MLSAFGAVGMTVLLGVSAWEKYVLPMGFVQGSSSIATPNGESATGKDDIKPGQ